MQAEAPEGVPRPLAPSPVPLPMPSPLPLSEQGPRSTPAPTLSPLHPDKQLVLLFPLDLVLYCEAFLTTYRTFISPEELIKKLQYRYPFPPDPRPLHHGHFRERGALLPLGPRGGS